MPSAPAVTRTDSIDRLGPAAPRSGWGLPQADVTLDGNAIVRQEKRVVGSFAYSDDEFAEAIRLSTLTDLGWTTSVALEESAAVFMDLAAGRSDIVRAVIRPSLTARRSRRRERQVRVRGLDGAHVLVSGGTRGIGFSDSAAVPRGGLGGARLRPDRPAEVDAAVETLAELRPDHRLGLRRL